MANKNKLKRNRQKPANSGGGGGISTAGMGMNEMTGKPQMRPDNMMQKRGKKKSTKR